MNNGVQEGHERVYSAGNVYGKERSRDEQNTGSTAAETAGGASSNKTFPGDSAERQPRVDDVVERDIDGVWFPAKVIIVE